jgi:hypothetical protein
MFPTRRCCIMRILTGDICLEDHFKMNYDLILSGQSRQLYYLLLCTHTTRACCIGRWDTNLEYRSEYAATIGTILNISASFFNINVMYTSFLTDFTSINSTFYFFPHAIFTTLQLPLLKTILQ